MNDDLIRSLLPTHGEAIDPVAMARRDLVKNFPARFYKEAGVAARDGGFAVTLDGKVARTSKQTPLVFPNEALARAVAAEWAAQTGVVNPGSMPLTRLANAAYDGVAHEMAATRAEIVKYAGSDLLCYRAAGPASLVAAQSDAWTPVLDWAGDALGARFVLSEGVMFVEQPAGSIEAARALIEPVDDPLALAALASMTTLMGSVLLALAIWREFMSPEAAWRAAQVDEDFGIATWGVDAEAADRRARRWAELEAAARLLAMTAGG